MSAFASPSGLDDAVGLAWIATVYLVIEGGCSCDIVGVASVSSVSSVDGGCSCPELFVVPLMSFNISSKCPPGLPLPATRPSLPFSLVSLFVVTFRFPSSGRSTGVSSRRGASMVWKCVHMRDGSASRTTNLRPNGGVEDDKVSSDRSRVPGTKSCSLDVLETLVRG